MQSRTLRALEAFERVGVALDELEMGSLFFAARYRDSLEPKAVARFANAMAFPFRTSPETNKEESNDAPEANPA